MQQEKPTSHTYFSQRLRLHYLDWGNSSAPHLLLIHGIHDHCHSWDWLADIFHNKHHVIAPDLRGHGDSEWSIGSGYGNLEYVYDIAQLVRQRKIYPVTVIAHSMGGTIASIYAGTYPELIKKLVLVEAVGSYPQVSVRDPSQKLSQWVESNHSLAGRVPKRYPTLEAAYQRMQETNPHLSPEQARHLTIHGSYQNEDGTYTWKFDNYTRTHTPYDVPEQDVIELWKRITCPVLIVNATTGYPHRIGHDGTDQYFSNARCVEISDAGHWIHHDQLVEFTDEVLNFLRGS